MSVRKALFVDGASLIVMASTFGIARPDYRQLRLILRQNTGTLAKKVRGPSVIVMPKMIFGGEKGEALKTVIEKSGFKLHIVETENGNDDRVLIAQIDAFKPRQGDEIILVSSDYDFVPVLREKRLQGARIHIVGTLGNGVGSRVKIGSALQHLITTGEFCFTDFRDIAPSVVYRLKGSPRLKTSDEKIGFTFRIDCNETAWKKAILEELSILSERFPGLRFQQIS